MPDDDRLLTGLRAAARRLDDAAPPTPRPSAATAAPARSRRRAPLLAAAVLAVLALVGGAVALLTGGDDGGGEQVAAGGDEGPDETYGFPSGRMPLRSLVVDGEEVPIEPVVHPRLRHDPRSGVLMLSPCAGGPVRFTATAVAVSSAGRCPGSEGEWPTRLMAAVPAWSVEGDGVRLVGGGVEAVFDLPAPTVAGLSSGGYRLESIERDGAVLPHDPIALALDVEGRRYRLVGPPCTTFAEDLAVDGSQLLTPASQPSSNACEGGAGTVALFELMRASPTWTHADGVLELEHAGTTATLRRADVAPPMSGRYRLAELRRDGVEVPIVAAPGTDEVTMVVDAAASPVELTTDGLCNDLMPTVVWDVAGLVIDAGVFTQMGCEDPAAAVEGAFADLLTSDDPAGTSTDDGLRLTGGGVEVTFASADPPAPDLPGDRQDPGEVVEGRYRVTSMRFAAFGEPTPGSGGTAMLTLRLGEDGLHLHDGCALWYWDVERTGGGIELSGPLRSTAQVCRLGGSGGAVAAQLLDGTWTVEGDTVRVEGPAGTLVAERIPASDAGDPEGIAGGTTVPVALRVPLLRPGADPSDPDSYEVATRTVGLSPLDAADPVALADATVRAIAAGPTPEEAERGLEVRTVERDDVRAIERDGSTLVIDVVGPTPAPPVLQVVLDLALVPLDGVDGVVIGPAASPAAGEVFMWNSTGGGFSAADHVAVARPLAGADPAERARAALEALIEGPSPEERTAGLSTMLDGRVGLVASVTLDETTAVVDLDGSDPALLNNLSTSAGSILLRTGVVLTLTAIDGIDAVQLRLDGSCEAFQTFVQALPTCPPPLTPEDLDVVG